MSTLSRRTLVSSAAALPALTVPALAAPLPTDASGALAIVLNDEENEDNIAA